MKIQNPLKMWDKNGFVEGAACETERAEGIENVLVFGIMGDSIHGGVRVGDGGCRGLGRGWRLEFISFNDKLNEMETGCGVGIPASRSGVWGEMIRL
ncbi:MAG: hypothetical protein OEY97_09475 [Nitrospirota bacterium]|nr:hypothetical protein [Nitrospirota bacterium]